MADSDISIPLCVSGFVSRKMKQKKKLWSRKPESGLKLAEVVEFIGEPWNKVVPASRFSKFHAKFWGKSMPLEGEQAWHNLQSTDGDVTMGDGDDDADDELIPGCCELDVHPNPVSDVDTIWIRAEYLRAYNYTESRYDLCYKRRRAQAIVYTGHPGSGKSVSLVYTLRRRCAERKPVIWYDGLESYIFVDDGVYKMAPDFHFNEFKIFVWTLVDSDQAPGGVPPELVRKRTRLFVLYASSPDSGRWSRLHKTVSGTTVVMNPWTWREMLRALPILLPDTQLTVAGIKETFDQLGPTPRIIQLLDEPVELAQYKEAVSIAISEITPDKLKAMVSNAKLLDLETGGSGKGVSNKLSLVSRTERDVVWSAHTVAPITESIKSRLARQLRIVSRNQQIDLYHLFSKSPQTKTMCGTLFEAIGLCIVPEGLDITLLPMVRLPQNPNAKSHPRWYTSHAYLTNETREALRQQALHRSEAIKFPPATTQEFTADEILSLREGVFFVPASDSQEGLDAFLLLHGILYILQFTVGQNHDIKPGFVKFLQKCQNVPPLEEWKFVFLIPPGTTLLCPEPKSELPGLVVREWNLSYSCLTGYAARSKLRGLRETDPKFWDELTSKQFEGEVPSENIPQPEDTMPAPDEEDGLDDSDVPIQSVISNIIHKTVPKGYAISPNGTIEANTEAERFSDREA